MKNNPTKIRYHSILDQSKRINKHNRYLSNLTKNTYESFDKQQFLSYHDELKSINSKNVTLSKEKDTNQCEELQRQFKNLLESVQNFLQKSEWMTKHQRIRINEWLVKLTYKQLNPVWKKNLNFYLAVMLEMMYQRKIGEPFITLPNDGPLPKLTIYDIPYPIRQKFAQSKEKSKMKSDFSIGSKDSKPLKKVRKDSIGNKQNKELLYKVSVLEKNSSWLENKNSEYSSNFNNLQKSDFEAQPFDLKIQLKPVFSNDKSRKNNINRVNHMSNKAKAHTGNRIKESVFYDYDKQNNANTINITRQLFKSKDKQQQTHKQNYFEIDMTIQSECQKLNESRLSESSKAFIKASEQIRTKFKQTDNQTLQFMSFLNKLKQKDRRI